MPVLIAAFEEDLDIVRAVAARLRDDGGEVRCFLEEDDYELREMGCKIAVGRLDDDFTMEAALTNVHTFMPLIPDALSLSARAEAEVAGFVGAAASSVGRADVAQTIAAISGVPGSPVSEACDAFADGLKGSASPLCLIRTGLIHGAERPLVRIDVRDPVAAVDVDVLAAVLAAADDHEELEAEWALGGTRRTLSGTEGQPAPGWLIQYAASEPLPNSAADALGVHV